MSVVHVSGLLDGGEYSLSIFTKEDRIFQAKFQAQLEHIPELRSRHIGFFYLEAALYVTALYCNVLFRGL